VTSVPIDRVLEEVRRTLRRGDLVKSVGMVRELARQAGQDPRSRHLQAKLAIEFGQAREAVGMLETLVFEMTGDDLRDATIDLARARELQGDAEGGLTTIRPELEAEGDTPAAAIAAAARLHALAGDDTAAITMLDRPHPPTTRPTTSPRPAPRSRSRPPKITPTAPHASRPRSTRSPPSPSASASPRPRS
jgi:thioredoxin-like negative regulator of GroEL